jgi:hypothetical protein
VTPRPRERRGGPINYFGVDSIDPVPIAVAGREPWAHSGHTWAQTGGIPENYTCCYFAGECCFGALTWVTPRVQIPPPPPEFYAKSRRDGVEIRVEKIGVGVEGDLR